MVQASPLLHPTTEPLGRRLGRLLGRWTSNAPALDPADLTDQIRKDLGFADGRAVPPRDPERD